MTDRRIEAPNFTCHGYPWQGTLVPWMRAEPPDLEAPHPLGPDWDFILVDVGDGLRWYGRCVNGASVILHTAALSGRDEPR